MEEFGTVADETEFGIMRTLDVYHAIRDGVDYPALLLTTGINDMRVPAWAPAKLAARLQSFKPQRPVLLRVDFDGGHRLSSEQRRHLIADEHAFMWSQLGDDN
jgi:prolyl oligopeptidase